MASVSGYQVNVKTANGTVEDLTVDCPEEWCVFDIKTHVVDNHPLHPPVRGQKLIYNGALLQDDKAIRDVFSKSYVVSIHLVISPAYLRSNSVPVNVRQETSDDKPHPPKVPISPPSASTQLPGGSPTNPIQPGHGVPQNEIRNRSQPSAQQPIAMAPFPANQMMWNNPYMLPPYYNPQLAQWYHSSFQGRTGGQLQDANPGRPEDADGLLLENQADREARGDGRDQQDPGLPDDLDAAGAGGAGGGLALMADNRRGRDAVDYAYMLMMLVFLISIGYLTGSFNQFVIFFAGVAIILMNQGGWFRLQRRQVRENQPPPIPPPQGGDQQDPPHPPHPLPGQQNPNDNPQTEETNGPVANTVDHEPRPGAVATVGMFVTSFFSSLFPQQIPELQGN